MTEYVVAEADEFEDGDRLIVEVNGREIGLFYADGEFYAYLNWCPHQGGPACEGPVTGQNRASYDRDELERELEWSSADRVIVCPWHSWEFELETGATLPDRSVGLASFPTKVEDGDVIVEA